MGKSTNLNLKSGLCIYDIHKIIWGFFHPSHSLSAKYSQFVRKFGVFIESSSVGRSYKEAPSRGQRGPNKRGEMRKNRVHARARGGRSLHVEVQGGPPAFVIIKLGICASRFSYCTEICLRRSSPPSVLLLDGWKGHSRHAFSPQFHITLLYFV